MSRLLVIAVSLMWTSSATAEASRPNVLFILTEDQGAQTGYHGTPGLQTPNMDWIAEGGVWFREAFANYPVCSPSKAVIYTGLYAHANGVCGNTTNYFKPLDEVSAEERSHPLYRRMAVRDSAPTLAERMSAAGYRMLISNKIHVAPNEKFPYDEWMEEPNARRFGRFIEKSRDDGRPWFFWCNLEPPHRPFRNSEDPDVDLTVAMEEVELPGYLPDTPAVRRDWAEYLDSVERADDLIGQMLDALRASGEIDNTFIVFMGDHGPGFHRGKMSPYDFGLRVPLAIRGPGVKVGGVVDELVSEVDLMPTLAEYVGFEKPKEQHGQSLMPLIRGEASELPGREYVFGEVIHDARSRDDGLQERSVYDGRYHLIYREGDDLQRDFNADLRLWEYPPGFGAGRAKLGAKSPAWHNRAFDSLVATKKEHPVAYRLLDELCSELDEFDPQPLELYDLRSDPWELENLVDKPALAEVRNRLLDALASEASETGDLYVTPEKIEAAKAP